MMSNPSLGGFRRREKKDVGEWISKNKNLAASLI